MTSETTTAPPPVSSRLPWRTGYYRDEHGVWQSRQQAVLPLQNGLRLTATCEPKLNAKGRSSWGWRVAVLQRVFARQCPWRSLAEEWGDAAHGLQEAIDCCRRSADKLCEIYPAEAGK